MTVTVLPANPNCGIMLGAMGFHSGRGATDWVPSASTQPAWIYSKNGESPVSFSFPVHGGYKGYILVSGPFLTIGGYYKNNWSITACTKDGDYYLIPTVNEKPKGLPATANDGKRILPPLQYRLKVTFTGEGQEKGLRVVVQDEQGRPASGKPVRVGSAPCVGEGTTDGNGIAVMRMPRDCP